jgi:hypothetical protein
MQCRTTILSVLLTALISTCAFAEVKPEKADAEAIIKKVREKYSTLDAYHFEHTIVVEEEQAGEKPLKIAEVTLVTASEKDKSPQRVFRGPKALDDWTDARESTVGDATSSRGRDPGW